MSEVLLDGPELTRAELVDEAVSWPVTAEHVLGAGNFTALLRDCCAGLGVAHEVLPSGAGHDASLFANAGIPSGMLFVRNRNGSHNPHEAMDLDDFMLGVQVLGDAAARIGASL